MNIEKFLTKKGLVFFAVFVLFTYLASQFNFSSIIGMPLGENQSFTFFQFFGPIAGGFLGAGIGVLTVLFAQILSFMLSGKEIALFNVLRLLPMLFAAYYFAKNKERLFNDKLSIFIPLFCMLLFIINPLAQYGWFYSLFWLIPVAMKLLPEKLFLRSIGATFMAHAVGTVVWIYSLSTMGSEVFPIEFWLALAPIALTERILFASGISISYVAFNTIFSKIDSLNIVNLKSLLNIDEKYVITLKSN